MSIGFDWNSNGEVVSDQGSVVRKRRSTIAGQGPGERVNELGSVLIEFELTTEH
jgi:hypothetical protein